MAHLIVPHVWARPSRRWPRPAIACECCPWTRSPATHIVKSPQGERRKAIRVCADCAATLRALDAQARDWASSLGGRTRNALRVYRFRRIG